MSDISGRKEEIVLFQGFSEPQSLQALSEWTMTRPSDLPPQAAHIHQLSHGSPLVISIIGSLLREHGHRWEYYVTQLEEKNLKKLSTARDAIHLSVEELPSRDEVMRLFSWFAVFDQGTRLSSKVIWIILEHFVFNMFHRTLVIYYCIIMVTKLMITAMIICITHIFIRTQRIGYHTSYSRNVLMIIFLLSIHLCKDCQMWYNAMSTATIDTGQILTRLKPNFLLFNVWHWLIHLNKYC